MYYTNCIYLTAYAIRDITCSVFVLHELIRALADKNQCEETVTWSQCQRLMGTSKQASRKYSSILFRFCYYLVSNTLLLFVSNECHVFELFNRKAQFHTFGLAIHLSGNVEIIFGVSSMHSLYAKVVRLRTTDENGLSGYNR